MSDTLHQTDRAEKRATDNVDAHDGANIQDGSMLHSGPVDQEDLVLEEDDDLVESDEELMDEGLTGDDLLADQQEEVKELDGNFGDDEIKR
jgi:hypothetical protein